MSPVTLTLCVAFLLRWYNEMSNKLTAKLESLFQFKDCLLRGII